MSVMRTDQFARHIRDLATDSYEGHKSRESRFAHFVTGVELVTPVAFDVLECVNREVLRGYRSRRPRPAP